MASQGNRLTQWLENELGISLVPDSFQSVSGGCIHTAMLAERRDGGKVFIKSNRPDTLPMFEAERQSLLLLRNANAIRVPHPYATGIIDDQAVFAMEGLALNSLGNRTSQSCLGEQLAELHQTRPDEEFGAEFDNYIGATPQPNRPSAKWAEFFVEQRLDFQFHLAAKNGLTISSWERLLAAVHNHLKNLAIEPSLLHGDLWGGNVGFLEGGVPVIFDPASYFGDAEADIAFTRFFGGFEAAFYSSYRRRFPEPEPVRHEIYNLYHVLNHFNLFGGSYGHQAERMIAGILAQIAG